jgi:AAA+ ATPase superfamily predicted ATPase
LYVRFVDREEELRILEDIWRSDKPGFIIVYGRRRIGKTRLLMEWMRDKPHLYVQCLPASDEVNLSRISKAIAEQLGLGEFLRVRFNGLDELLAFLSKLYRGRLVIVFDEFTYWARLSSKMLGELQYFIDHVLPTTRFIIVISGSIMGVMYRDVLGYGSPLYGRRTATLRIRELSPWHIKDFVRINDKVDRAKIYGLIGGLPYYLALIYGSHSLKEVLEKLFGSRSSPIYDEPYLLFREEFRNPETYYSIVSAIAHGYNRLSSISDYTGIPRTHLPKYLKILVDLEYIEYVKPLFSKRGWYRVRDPILRTWFKLVEPNIYLVEAGYYDRLINYIMDNIDLYMGEVYEEIAYKYILEYFIPKLNIRDMIIGKYMYRGVEIDLVVLSHKTNKALIYEVKWSDLDSREVEREFRRLQSKIEKTPLRKYNIEMYLITRRAPKIRNVITIKDIPI